MLLTAEQVMECPLIITCDMNQGDIDREWEAMCIRQKLIEDFYENIRLGRWDAGQVEEMLDCIAEHQIDPYEFVDAVVENVELVLSGGCAVAPGVDG